MASFSQSSIFSHYAKLASTENVSQMNHQWNHVFHVTPNSGPGCHSLSSCRPFFNVTNKPHLMLQLMLRTCSNLEQGPLIRWPNLWAVFFRQLNMTGSRCDGQRGLSAEKYGCLTERMNSSPYFYHPQLIENSDSFPGVRRAWKTGERVCRMLIHF